MVVTQGKRGLAATILMMGVLACAPVAPLSTAQAANYEGRAVVSAGASTINGEPVGEVLINGKVALRVREAAGGWSPEERAELSARRLRRAIEQGATHEDITVGKRGGEWAVLANGELIITADSVHARKNEATAKDLAEKWRDNVVSALLSPPPPDSEEDGGLPTVMVVILECPLDAPTPVPDPRAESVVINELIKSGFRVKELDAATSAALEKATQHSCPEGSINQITQDSAKLLNILRTRIEKVKAKLIIAGEAFSEEPRTQDDQRMPSCAATVEVRAIDTQTRDVLCTGWAHGAGAHTAIQVACKNALANAAKSLCRGKDDGERFIERLTDEVTKVWGRGGQEPVRPRPAEEEELVFAVVPPGYGAGVRPEIKVLPERLQTALEDALDSIQRITIVTTGKARELLKGELFECYRSGLCDPTTMAKIGKLLGAHEMVRATITGYESRPGYMDLRVDVKVIDFETGVQRLTTQLFAEGTGKDALGVAANVIAGLSLQAVAEEFLPMKVISIEDEGHGETGDTVLIDIGWPERAAEGTVWTVVHIREVAPGKTVPDPRGEVEIVKSHETGIAEAIIVDMVDSRKPIQPGDLVRPTARPDPNALSLSAAEVCGRWLQLAESAAEDNDPNKAQQLLDKLSEALENGEIGGTERLAEVRLPRDKLSQLTEALGEQIADQAEFIPALDKLRAVLLVGCAGAAARAGNIDLAVKQIQDAYRLDPGSEGVRAAVGALQNDLGRDLVPPTVRFLEPQPGREKAVGGFLWVKCACEDMGVIRKVALYQGDRREPVCAQPGRRGHPHYQELNCKVDLIRGRALRVECEDMDGNIGKAEIEIRR